MHDGIGARFGKPVSTIDALDKLDKRVGDKMRSIGKVVERETCHGTRLNQFLVGGDLEDIVCAVKDVRGPHLGDQVVNIVDLDGDMVDIVAVQ